MPTRGDKGTFAPVLSYEPRHRKNMACCGNSHTRSPAAYKAEVSGQLLSPSRLTPRKVPPVAIE